MPCLLCKKTQPGKNNRGKSAACGHQPDNQFVGQHLASLVAEQGACRLRDCARVYVRCIRMDKT